MALARFKRTRAYMGCSSSVSCLYSSTNTILLSILDPHAGTLLNCKVQVSTLWSDVWSFMIVHTLLWLVRLVSVCCFCYCFLWLFVTSLFCLLPSFFLILPFWQGPQSDNLTETSIPTHYMLIPVSVNHQIWFLLLSSFVGRVCASVCFGFTLFPYHYVW